MTWKEVKTKLLKRFGALRSLSPSEMLFAFDDFVENFEDKKDQLMIL